MRLCIRGASDIWSRLFDILKSNMPEADVVCYADQSLQKVGSDMDGIPIVSVAEAVEYYKSQLFEKFVISLSFDNLTLKTMVNELLECHVSKDDIMFITLPTGGLPEGNQTVKILIPYNTVRKLMPVEFGIEGIVDITPDSYDRTQTEITPDSYDRTQTQWILCGSNWLSEYLEKLYPGKFMHLEEFISLNKNYRDALFFICGEKANFYWIYDRAPHCSIISLIDYCKYYFHDCAYFYRAYCGYEQVMSGSFDGVATGISYTRDSLQAEDFHYRLVNVANAGQDLYYDYRLFCILHQRAKEIKKRIKYTVLGLWPCCLRYDMSKSKANDMWTLPYYPLVQTLHNLEGASAYMNYYLQESKKITAYIPEINMKKLFGDYYAKQCCDGKFDNERCFDEQSLSANQRLKISYYIRQEFNKPYEDTKLENMKILDDYLRFLTEHKIQIIIYIPPYTRIYKRSWKHEYIEELMDYLKILKEKYDYRLMDLSTLDLDDTYFQDYSHTNRKGAKLVSGYLKSVIDE